MKTSIKRILANTVGQLLRLNGGRIFYFHSIHPTHPLAHRPKVFRSMVELVAHSGKKILTIAELGQAIRNGDDVQDCLSITFDDGYADNAEIALPILAEMGVTATFFVAAGLIADINHIPNDSERKHHLYANLPMMSKRQLRELSDAGIEVGSHTFSHRYLQNDNSERVQQELHDSKVRLEEIIGKPVVSFAFPNGEVPNDARQVMQEEGYLQAVTTRWDCVKLNTDPYFLPRQIIDVPDRAKDFEAKLTGRYDYMKIHQTLRHRSKNSK